MDNVDTDKIGAEVSYFNTVAKYQSNASFGGTASSARSNYNGQQQHQHQQQQQQQQQRILKQKRKQTSPTQQLLHQQSHQSSLLQTPDQLYEAQRKIRSQQTFAGFQTNNSAIYPGSNTSNTNTSVANVNKVRI